MRPSSRQAGFLLSDTKYRIDEHGRQFMTSCPLQQPSTSTGHAADTNRLSKSHWSMIGATWGYDPVVLTTLSPCDAATLRLRGRLAMFPIGVMSTLRYNVLFPVYRQDNCDFSKQTSEKPRKLPPDLHKNQVEPYLFWHLLYILVFSVY